MDNREVVIIHRLPAEQVGEIRADEESKTIRRERYRMVNILMERYKESFEDALRIVEISEEDYKRLYRK